jgi:hypothetical protein
LLIVGAETCSAFASCPRVDGPPKTRTESADSLASRGVAFEDEPHLIAQMPDHDLWMTFFRDPDRNYLGLMSEVRRG